MVAIGLLSLTFEDAVQSDFYAQKSNGVLKTQNLRVSRIVTGVQVCMVALQLGGMVGSVPHANQCR